MLKQSVLLVLALIAPITLLGAAQPATNLTVRAFQIPQVQSWDAIGPETGHGISELTCRGDATAAFPDGILDLTTEFAPNADNSAIQREIMNRVLLGNGDFRAKRLLTLEIGKLEAVLTAKNPAAETSIEKERIEGSWKIYNLKVELRPSDATETALHLTFDAGSHCQGGSMGGEISSTLFSETVVIPDSRKSKLVLVGFPSHDEGPRGTIYWLAISVTSPKSNEAPSSG